MLEAKYPLMYSKQYMKQAFTLNRQSDMSFSKQKDNKMIIISIKKRAFSVQYQDSLGTVIREIW